MTAWDVGTWLAARVLGPGAVIVFAAFLRDLRRLLGAPKGPGVKLRNVAVATGTASGKSLVYQLATFERCVADPAVSRWERSPSSITMVEEASSSTIDRGISIANLIAVMKLLLREVFRRDVTTRQGELINIDPSGKVSQARIKSSTLNNRTVETCIEEAVETWTLPAPAGGVTTQIDQGFDLK